MLRRPKRGQILAAKQPGPMRADTLTVPAPIGGLNARDALASMPPTDAIKLDNWFPRATSVDLRNGYVKWATGLPANVETLMTYNNSTLSKLFAASGTAFYDTTVQGAVGAPVVTGLTNARWQHTNMGTPGGQFLIAVNGADYPRVYNGNLWALYATTTTSQAIGAITHVGTLATVRTTAAHNLMTGNSVTVNGVTPAAYNGTFIITVPAPIAPVAIASITRVGTLATLTTTGPHGLATNAIVTISGTTPAGFSGTYTITVTGATTFTYVMAVDPGANASVVGTYVVLVNTFSYTMLTDPLADASVVGTYSVFPAITGVDPRLFIHVNLYATRIFFVEKDSTRVWYLPVNSVGGAAAQLDFAPLLNEGGYIVAMATWTIDNSDGVNEYAVFISSQGEVLMYTGTDPSDAANWRKAGRYVIGRPVGRRCFMRAGSDVVLLTSDGFMPMSQVLLTDRTQRIALSDKITNLVSADLTNYAANFGWQPVFHPGGDKFLFNVPQIAGKMQYQYVMNTITGAWCRFTGWKANSFATMADTLYFGSNLGSTANSAFVAKADFGFADDGGYVSSEVKTAFQFFGARGREKQITMAKPIFMTGGAIQASIGIDMDFGDAYPATQPSFSGNGGTLWGTKKWNTFPWSSGDNISDDWQSVVGVGDAAALHMRVVSNSTALQWQSIQYVYRFGKIL